MKVFDIWYENVGIELLDSCLFRLPKGLAEKTWKAALECVKNCIDCYESDDDNIMRITDFLNEEIDM